MKIQVLFFGPLQELFGQYEQFVESVTTTDEVLAILKSQQPELGKQTYVLALNEEIIQTNQALASGDVLALLPPFSGG
jgi:molybdopterin synthase sulfur carrier subunit